MALILLAFALLLPALEIFTAVLVAEAIGILETVLVLLCISLLGVRIARRQGRSTIRRVRIALAQGRPPAFEALDGALRFLGALLLALPGFITAAFGLVVLAPPTRALVRAAILRHPGARVVRSFARRANRYDVDANSYETPLLP